MFGKDLASAYVLHHQMSTVLKFRMWFRGSDSEFEGQCMGTVYEGTNVFVFP